MSAMKRASGTRSATKVDQAADGQYEDDDKAPDGALRRGLRILEVLIGATSPMSLSVVAEASGLSSSTALRLLRVLEQANYVLKDSFGNSYIASPKALTPLPLNHFLNAIRQEARQSLQVISAEVEDTLMLSLFVYNQRLVLDVVHWPGSILPYHENWPISPLHSVASGKVLLAAMSEDDRKAALGPGPYSAEGPATVTDPAELKRELEEFARTGYVFARDGVRPGVTGVAAAVRSWSGQTLGALIVTGRSSNLSEERINQVGVKLAGAADLLTLEVPALQTLVPFARTRPGK